MNDHQILLTDLIPMHFIICETAQSLLSYRIVLSQYYVVGNDLPNKHLSAEFLRVLFVVFFSSRYICHAPERTLEFFGRHRKFSSGKF